MGRTVDAVLAVVRHPSLFVAGACSALATGAALAAAFVAGIAIAGLDVLGPWTALLGMLLVYDLALTVTKPAVLPGLYATVRSDPGQWGPLAVLRTVVGDCRSNYHTLARAGVRTRLAGLGFAILLAPVVVAAALVVVTGISVGLYAVDAVQSPHPVVFMYLLLGLVLTIRAAGTAPVALADLLAIDSESPRRSWCASAGYARSEPFHVGGIAIRRLALGTLPFLIGFGALLAVPSEGPSGLLVPVAGVVLVGTVTKPVEAVALVRGYDSLVDQRTADRPTWDGRPGIVGRVPQPSRKTVLVVVLLVGLAVASAGVRVADVRPNPGPNAPPGFDDPTAAPAAGLYAVAVNRTGASSRNASMTVTGRNLTAGTPREGLRATVAVDFASREIGVQVWEGDGETWNRRPTTYVSDGLYLRGSFGTRPDFVAWTSEVNGQPLYAAPQYATLVHEGPYVWLPESGAIWTRHATRDDAVVLVLDDPGAVEAAATSYDVPTREYLNGSRIRVHVDPETQRLEQVSVIQRTVEFEDESRERVRERSLTETTITYRYEGVDVRRPDGLGFQPAAVLWDALYY